MKIVSCGSCGARNRLPRLYLRGAPVCGRCRAELPESALQRTVRSAYRTWNWSIGAVALLSHPLILDRKHPGKRVDWTAIQRIAPSRAGACLPASWEWLGSIRNLA